MKIENVKKLFNNREQWNASRFKVSIFDINITVFASICSRSITRATEIANRTSTKEARTATWNSGKRESTGKIILHYYGATKYEKGYIDESVCEWIYTAAHDRSTKVTLYI